MPLSASRCEISARLTIGMENIGVAPLFKGSRFNSSTFGLEELTMIGQIPDNGERTSAYVSLKLSAIRRFKLYDSMPGRFNRYAIRCPERFALSEHFN